jgi:hypothetical protein
MNGPVDAKDNAAVTFAGPTSFVIVVGRLPHAAFMQTNQTPFFLPWLDLWCTSHEHESERDERDIRLDGGITPDDWDHVPFRRGLARMARQGPAWGLE